MRGRLTRTHLALAGVTLVVAALHVASAQVVPGPTITYDEAGYLGNARWLAHVGPTWEMPLSPSYSFGYPLVLAPAFRFIRSPDALWTAIQLINATLLATLVPLLYAVVRRIGGVAARPALVAATVGALTPAVVSTAGWATAENLSLPLVVAVVLALHAMLAGDRTVARLWFGPLVAALYATHPRNVLVVAVAALALLAMAVRPVVPRWVAAANLAVLGFGVLAVRAVQAAEVRARWDGVHRIEGSPGDAVDMATSASGLADLLRASLGQLWYLSVGLLGVALLGVGAVATLVRRRPVAADGATGASVVAVRWTAAITLAMASAVFVTSVAFFARNHLRDDHLLYGRHNDSFVPIWIATAVALLLASDVPVRTVLRWFAAAGGAVVVIGLAAIALLDPTAKGGVYLSRAVPALIRLIDGPPEEVLVRGVLWALGALGVMAVLVALTRRPMAAVAVFALWSAWAGVGLVQRAQDRPNRVYDEWDLPADVARIGVQEASIDVSGRGGATVAIYPFAMPHVHFVPYLPGRNTVPDTSYAFDSLDDPALREEGARLVLVDEGGTFAGQTPSAFGLWVRPGPELDRLAAQGWLLPPDGETVLPETAREGRVSVPDEVEVEAGGTVEIDVALTHEGTGAPWPDAASIGDEGAVVVAASVRDPDGAVVASDVVADLSSWALPGDSVDVTLALDAHDGSGAPLAAGTYSVTLELTQRGEGWATPLGETALRIT